MQTSFQEYLRILTESQQNNRNRKKAKLQFIIVQLQLKIMLIKVPQISGIIIHRHPQLLIQQLKVEYQI